MRSESPPPSRAGFLGEIESVRGIAALFVAFGHSVGVFLDSAYLAAAQTPIHTTMDLAI